MSKTKECCPLLPLIIARDASRDERRGFEIATPFGLNDGKTHAPVLVYRFPKSRRGSPDKLEDATYAVVKACPFCGTAVSK